MKDERTQYMGGSQKVFFCLTESKHIRGCLCVGSCNLQTLHRADAAIIFSREIFRKMDLHLRYSSGIAIRFST